MTSTDLNKAPLIKERSTGLGGTDLAGICGVNPWKTPVQVYNEKVAALDNDKSAIVLEQPKPAALWRMQMGNRLEHVVQDCFEERTKLIIQRDIKCLRHPTYPFLLAHVDGLINDDTVFEAKTCGANGLFNNSWGKEREDYKAIDADIPVQYRYQIQWYLLITNREFAYLATLLAGVDDFRVYKFDRDYMLGLNMRKKAKNFWLNHVEKRIPPEPLTAQDSFSLHPKVRKDEMAKADESIRRVILKNKSVRSDMKNLFNVKDALDAKITNFIGDKQGVEYNGRTIATWRENKNGKRILKLT